VSEEEDELKEEVQAEGWFEDYAEDSEEDQIDEYDITATPNDFNVLTLNSFVEAGTVKIPGFQRNFVWDITRASKLIESLILGLPVPQLFLYEQARNKFLVIDGQQRLMSIYYFIKKRFPRKEKRTELRAIFDEHGGIPDSVLHDDAFFQTFGLRLPEKLPGKKSKFKGLNYSTLGDYKTQFDLRPIRNIVVRQSSPDNDDSSIYEVFNRLNTGGVNLRPQEIRTSMYHSKFYEMLYSINTEKGWRSILGTPVPDLHMKDIEILLRGFAMLIDGTKYSPSMVKFLNHFSRSCETVTDQSNEYLRGLFCSFVGAASELPEDAFVNKKNNRFNIALYEAAFTATCEKAFAEHRALDGKIDSSKLLSLANDEAFIEAASKGTTGSVNVEARLNRARTWLNAL
jgi:uncharacterized protein with ParB-like and HNH nuclease domain